MKPDNQSPLCGKIESELLFADGRDYFVANGDSDEFAVWFCHGCGIGYSTPFLNDIDLQEYYPDDFEAYVSKKSFSAFLQKLKYRQDLKLIKRALKTKNMEPISLFEIGAGRGEFLYEAKQSGFEVAGLEPGEKGVEFAQNEYGIDLLQGFASSLDFKRKYDVVVMRHVLEHLNDITPCLRKIHDEGLKPNGVLYIKVPNMGSRESELFGKFWHGFDLPRHRFHFTRKGVAKLLRSIGFNRYEIKNELVPVDFIRSLTYFASHSTNQSGKIIGMFVMLPRLILYLLISPILFLFSLFIEPGRIIITTSKEHQPNEK